jgi:hypothetical protein
MVGVPLLPLGVRGLFLLAKQIRKLEADYGERGAIHYLATLLQSMEEFGTGGAGFRFVYSAFLHEAGEMLNDPKLNDFSVEMTQIGDLWRQFSLECGRKIKKRSNITYNELSDMLHEIATAEKKFFLALRKYVKTM